MNFIIAILLLLASFSVAAQERHDFDSPNDTIKVIGTFAPAPVKAPSRELTYQEILDMDFRKDSIEDARSEAAKTAADKIRESGVNLKRSVLAQVVAVGIMSASIALGAKSAVPFSIAGAFEITSLAEIYLAGDKLEKASTRSSFK